MRLKSGFTLIELLVVISIIGVVATVIAPSLNKARDKAQNANKVKIMQEIQKALELYHLDNKEYPRASGRYGVNTNNYGINASSAKAHQFESDLAPYITIDISDKKIFGGGAGLAWGNFYYRSSPGNNYQGYGMGITLSGNYSHLSENDGGYFPSSTHSSQFYELGENPSYCMKKYTGTRRNWIDGIGGNTICVGGN